MSCDHYRRQAQQAQSAIARLQRDKSQQAKKAADLSGKISSASEAARRTTNASALAAKMRDIERYGRDKANVEGRVADLESKIAQQQKKLHDAQASLAKEEARYVRKHESDSKRQATRQSTAMQSISRKLQSHDALHQETQMAIERLMQLPERITVLFLAANPVDQQQLRLDEEVRYITETIRKAKHRDSVELHSVWAIRPIDVLQAINEHRPTVVHFSGHGSAQDELVFQDDSGQSKLVSKEAIVQLMKASSGDIRLVFFNTCYSRNQAEAVVEHVDVAIGMNTAIGDNAARVFASQFYSAVGFGLSVERAFEQAKALVMLEGIHEQNTPELFLRDGLDPESVILVSPSAGDLQTPPGEAAG